MSEKNSDQELNTNDLLTALIDKLSTVASNNGLSAEQLEVIMTRAGLASAEGMRLSLKPENPEPTHISAFFTVEDKARYGSWEDRPQLSRKTYFCGIEEKSDRLMPAEIEAYNAITEYRTARNGQWKAQIKQNGEHKELWVSVPFETLDQRMNLPSLILILLELNGGPSTADVHSLIRQIEHLKGLLVKSGKSVADLETELINS